jgi:hypothetical protein
VSVAAHLAAVAISLVFVRIFGGWLVVPLVLFLMTIVTGILLLRLSRSMRARHVLGGAVFAAFFVSLGLYTIDWAAATTDEQIKFGEFLRYLAHPPKLGDVAFIVVPLFIMCSAASLALLFRRREASPPS